MKFLAYELVPEEARRYIFLNMNFFQWNTRIRET